MRKSTNYIILLLFTAGVIGLLLTGNNEKEKVFDNRITLQKRDKIPYGTHIAFESLQYLFPGAHISVNSKEPGYWDSLSDYASDQALIIVTPHFYADAYEMKKMIRFAEQGNDVFISSRTLSSSVEDIFAISTSPINETTMKDWENKTIIDRLYLQLINPPFLEGQRFTYDGSKFNAWIVRKDTTFTDELGTDDLMRTNFVHFKAGKGNIYLHLAPLAFSNYFLLHKDNIRYYENAFSVISPGVRKVVWDEYYINKRSYYDSNQFGGHPGWMNVLFRYKGLKWALLVAIFAILLYVFMEMRRRQRYIPVMARPRNDSLDFVKTIGRLYHDRADHSNLSRKMAAFFLEHVRNKYKLPTSNLDEEFINKLQFKTGCDEHELSYIVSFIQQLRIDARVSEKQLADFHRRLERFYERG